MTIVKVVSFKKLDFGSNISGFIFRLANNDQITMHNSEIFEAEKEGKVARVKAINNTIYTPVLQWNENDGGFYQIVAFERLDGLTDGFEIDKQYVDNEWRRLIFEKFDEKENLYHFSTLSNGWQRLKLNKDELHDLQLRA